MPGHKPHIRIIQLNHLLKYLIQTYLFLSGHVLELPPAIFFNDFVSFIILVSLISISLALRRILKTI